MRLSLPGESPLWEFGCRPCWERVTAMVHTHRGARVPRVRRRTEETALQRRLPSASDLLESLKNVMGWGDDHYNAGSEGCWLLVIEAFYLAMALSLALLVGWNAATGQGLTGPGGLALLFATAFIATRLTHRFCLAYRRALVAFLLSLWSFALGLSVWFYLEFATPAPFAAAQSVAHVSLASACLAFVGFGSLFGTVPVFFLVPEEGETRLNALIPASLIGTPSLVLSSTISANAVSASPSVGLAGLVVGPVVIGAILLFAVGATVLIWHALGRRVYRAYCRLQRHFWNHRAAGRVQKMNQGAPAVGPRAKVRMAMVPFIVALAVAGVLAPWFVGETLDPTARILGLLLIAFLILPLASSLAVPGKWICDRLDVVQHNRDTGDNERMRLPLLIEELCEVTVIVTLIWTVTTDHLDGGLVGAVGTSAAFLMMLFLVLFPVSYLATLLYVWRCFDEDCHEAESYLLSGPTKKSPNQPTG